MSSRWSVTCPLPSTRSSTPAPASRRPATKDRSRSGAARSRPHAAAGQPARRGRRGGGPRRRRVGGHGGDLELAESLLVAAEAHLASGDVAGAPTQRSVQLRRPRSAVRGRPWPVPCCCGHGAGRRSSRLAEQMAASENAAPLRLPPRSRSSPPRGSRAAHRAAPSRPGQRAAGQARRTAGSSAMQQAAALRITASWSCCAAVRNEAPRRQPGVRILKTTTPCSGPSSCARSPLRRASVWPASACNSPSTTIALAAARPPRKRGARSRCSPPPNRPTTKCWPICWRGCGW